MSTPDSKLGALVAQNARPVARKALNAVATACVMVGMIGGGASLGYFLGVQQERSDRIAEIARLQEANQIALDATIKRAGEVVETAMTASEKAEEATSAAKTAAQKAATSARTAAAAKNAATSTPAARTEVVNRTIREANAKMQESGK